MNHLAECQRFHGKTLRHRFTGQVRTVAVWDDHVQFCQDRSGEGWPATFDRSARKAWQWLRNADEVAA